MYFDVQNSNPMFIFVCRDLKNRFFNIVEKKRYCGRVFLRQAAMGLAQRLRRFASSHAACNRRCRAAQSFALVQKKLINSTLFAAGCNDTLEFISKLTEQLYFFDGLIL